MFKRLMVLFAVLALLAGCSKSKDNGYSDDKTPGAAASASSAYSDDDYSKSSSPAAAAGSGNAVTVKNLAFDPAKLSTAAGTEVTWTNKDGFEHTATSGTPDKPDGKFDISLKANGTGSFKFASAGTFKYFCKIHNQMTGEVVVS